MCCNLCCMFQLVSQRGPQTPWTPVFGRFKLHTADLTVSISILAHTSKIEMTALLLCHAQDTLTRLPDARWFNYVTKRCL